MGVVIGNKIKHLFLTMMREMYVHLSVFYGNKTDKIDLQNVPGIIYMTVLNSVSYF